ncbi:MAG: YedE-related selenium metabolism membrane protein, partial [Treponema sp.]|nr:YedE-related selenium metabolism membrane protein [Treponema sp.]
MRKVLAALSSRGGIILTGAVVGTGAVLLTVFGNPGNMGICVACFTRDIAGALGMHRAAAVQYLRPEIPAFILGSFLAALLAGEWKPRGGSAPLVRFFLGFLAMIGALVFLGCPWRAYLRLAGGDGNAIFGIAGLVTGILGGIGFLKRGYSLGRSRPMPKAAGFILPILALVLLALLIAAPLFGRDAAGAPTGPIFFSKSGPGSQAAPVLIALGIGLLIGFLAQRTRFCTVGAVRDLVLFKDPHLFFGVLALVLAAFLSNLAFGLFKPGFEKQAVSHTNQLWNFGGMVLSGLAFTLAGG